MCLQVGRNMARLTAYCVLDTTTVSVPVTVDTDVAGGACIVSTTWTTEPDVPTDEPPYAYPDDREERVNVG